MYLMLRLDLLLLSTRASKPRCFWRRTLSSNSHSKATL